MLTATFDRLIILLPSTENKTINYGVDSFEVSIINTVPLLFERVDVLSRIDGIMLFLKFKGFFFYGDLHGTTFSHATTLRHDYKTNRVV